MGENTRLHHQSQEIVSKKLKFYFSISFTITLFLFYRKSVKKIQKLHTAILNAKAKLESESCVYFNALLLKKEVKEEPMEELNDCGVGQAEIPVRTPTDTGETWSPEIVKTSTRYKARKNEVDRLHHDISRMHDGNDILNLCGSRQRVQTKTVFDMQPFKKNERVPKIKAKKNSLKATKTKVAKRKKTPFSKVIKSCQVRADNLIFSKCRLGSLMVCTLCGFETRNVLLMSQHIKDFHEAIGWTKNCYACKKNVKEGEKTLHDEFLHLLNHVEGKLAQKNDKPMDNQTA